VTLSRLWPSTNGPGSPTAFAGAYTAGITFRCLSPKVQWLQAIGIWVPAGGDTSPPGGYKTQLWQGLTSTTAQAIAGTSATATGLTAGAWNFITLPSPVPLTCGDTPYVAGVGWTSVNGFPDTQNQFGFGQPFAAGFTSGQLFAYSDQGASAAIPTGAPQGGFSVVASPPQYPDASSNSSNFWVDVLTSDTAPAGYTGPYELYPNNTGGNLSVVVDLNVNYNVGTEVALASGPGIIGYPLLGYKYVSPATAASLATRASLWTVDATGLIRGEIANTVIASPSWSGAAGSGWVTANLTPNAIVPPGKYVAAVYNSAGAGGGWNAKDSVTSAFGAGGPLASGISNGPLSAPAQASASTCYDYNGANGGATPPFSAGTTEPGQCCFGQLPGGGVGSPYLYAGLASGSNPQNYFVSPIFGAAVLAPAAGYLPDAYDRSQFRRQLVW